MSKTFLLVGLSVGAMVLEESPLRVRRFPENPIIRPEMLPGEDGANINGPCMIRVPDWVSSPLGKYYLYFAHHNGSYIRMAYADRLEGPWSIKSGGVLSLEQVPGCVKHIASPDAVIDEEKRSIRLYFHGVDGSSGEQVSRVALSSDGLHFEPRPDVLGPFYFRVFRRQGAWYAMAKGGRLLRSETGLTQFEAGPNPLPGGGIRKAPFNDAGPRHVGLDLQGDRLWVVYSNIGDAPERILRCAIDCTPDWTMWKASEPEEVLRPELKYEGTDCPVQPSRAGASKGPENALRDPYVFVEEGRRYLVYSVAGESGIAIAEINPL